VAAKDTVTRILITAKDEASAVFTSLQKTVAGIATAISAYFSSKLFGDSVTAAEDLEKQMLKLEGVIQATGGAAGLTAQEIDEMARRLDEATLGSAAGFRDAAAQLLTFKSIGRDSFETVLELAQDLADAGFGSVTTNAVQLGKALEDPVKGLTALTRSGVTFTAEQQALIKTLVATGRAAEAQGLILEAVAGQVGGVARQMGGGLSGALDLVGMRFTELKEQLGTAILPAFTELATKLSTVLTAVRDSGAVEKLGDAFGYVASKAEKFGQIIAVAAGVVAANAIRAYTTALGAATVASGAKTVAAGALSAALGAVATAGRLATGALLALGRATPVLAITGAITWLVSKLVDSKTKAEEAEAAVDSMLNQESGTTAAALQEVAQSADFARFKLEEVQRTFMALTAEGKTTAEALTAIATAADLSTVDGIAALAADMELLRQSALATGEQIQAAIADRLKKLSAEELREFGIQAEMAFNRGQLSADQFASVIEARAIAAARNLGIEVATAVDGIGAKFGEAIGNVGLLIESYDQLKASGVDAAQVLEQAILSAIKAAENPVELNSLTEAVREVGKAGQLSEQQVLAMLDAIRRKTDQVTPGINSVSEALQALGIISDQSLRETAKKFEEAYRAVVKLGGSVREQQAAFQAYARAAIAANNGVVSATLKAEGQMLGLNVEADKTGKVIVRSMSEAAEAVDKIRSAADGSKRSVRGLSDEVERLSGLQKLGQQNLDPLDLADPRRRPNRSAPGQSGTQLARASGRFSVDIGDEGAFDEAFAQMYNKLLQEMKFDPLTSRDAYIKALQRAEVSAMAYAAEQVEKQRKTQQQTDTPQPAPTTTPSTGMAPYTTPRQSYNVNINLNGRNRTIGTASDADARALVGLLQDLEART
jgi:hypothetical protein